jgi:hypothetical protein
MKQKVYKRVLLDSSRSGVLSPIGMPELIYYPSDESIIDVIKAELSKVRADVKQGLEEMGEEFADKYLFENYSKFGTYDNTIDGWFEEGEESFVGIISSDSPWFKLVDSFHFDYWDDETFDKWCSYQAQACEDNALN